MVLRASALLWMFVATGCVYHSRAAARLYETSLRNQARIDQIALGQSIEEVRSILGAPQRRDAVRTSRGDEEIWGYLTDYHHSLMKSVQFIDGKVVQIRDVPYTREH